MAIINGGPGNDTLFGTAGADTLNGFGGNDLLDGGAGNDVLLGSEGDDTLLGGSGNDGFRISIGDTAFGNDSVDGGTGIDNIGVGLDFSVINGAVVDFGQHTITSVDGTVAFSNIEGAFGTRFDDTFLAFDPSRVLTGLGNPNGTFDFTTLMQGFGGHDYFVGDSRDGYSELVQYMIAPSGVVVNLAAGTASDGYGYTDTLVDINGVQGSQFDDLLIGGGTGTNFNGLHLELFEGLAGNDTIVGSSSPVGDVANYLGAPSGVTVNLALGTASDGYDSDPFTGGVQSYTDVLIGLDAVAGSNFNDTLIGDNNDNFFDARNGNDFVDGGAATDTISYGLATAAVHIDLALGTSSITGGLGTDTWVNVEAIRGGDFDDTLRGQDGVDNVLDGGAGADVLDGRGGTDLARYDRSIHAVEVDLSAGFALDGYDVASTDALVSIERVRGSKFDDSITGDDGDNGFEGWAGNDTLDGGAGTDTAEYANSQGPVNVDLAAGAASDGWGGADLLISMENVTGSGFDDSLTGDGNANLLDGRAGADTMSGGLGDDTFIVDNAGDVTSDSGGIDTVDAFVDGAALGAGVENLVMHVAGTGIGNDSANVLTSGGGLNTLVGGLGDDTYNVQAGDVLTDEGGTDLANVTLEDGQSFGLGEGSGVENLTLLHSGGGTIYGNGNELANRITPIGGAGDVNVLTGGGGADVFRFDLSGAQNFITDFDRDVLDLTGLVAGAVYPHPGNPSLAWLVQKGYLDVDSAADVVGGAAHDTVVQWDADGSAGEAYALATIVTLMDATLGTIGHEHGGWLV